MSNPQGILQRLAHEPVLAFVLLGLAIFALDRWLIGPASSADGSDRIVVTATQQATLREALRAESGREPDTHELQARLDRWIDEQVLYREALALGLDRKDLIVHRQLTQKMRLLLDSSAELPATSEAELQAWLDQHAQRYAHPGAVSFQQVFLSRGRHGAALPKEAARISAQLAAAPEEYVGLGDAFLTGQLVNQADPAQLRREFGPEFGTRIQALPEGRWSPAIPSGFGQHFVRITLRSPGRPAQLDEVRDRVSLDYRMAQRERQTRQALDRLRQQYQIEIEDAAG